MAVAKKFTAADNGLCADMAATDCRKADNTSQALAAGFTYTAADNATCVALADGKCRKADKTAVDFGLQS